MFTSCDSDLQVESIILSIISMLSSPNDESPANVDAAVGVVLFHIVFTSFSLVSQASILSRVLEINIFLIHEEFQGCV